jgi:hypothetical protein
MKQSTLLATLMLLVFTACVSQAAWPTDPLVNLPVVDRAGEQVVPKLAATQFGSSYIGWYDNSSGNYDIWLQHLDSLGDEEWPHNGILISDHPQNSWVTDWDLIVDSNDNAILVFNDIRAGGDWDIYAYKVAPDGTLLWGVDGIAISDNVDFEVSPMVIEAADGDLVIVWAWSPDMGDGKIMMQRLAPDGTLRFAPGGIEIAGEPGYSPGFCNLVSDGAGGAVVSWILDMSTYMSPRHYIAERFDSNGASLWGGPVAVYTTNSLPMGYVPVIQPDNAGGAFLLWHAATGSLFNSYVQHLDADGLPLFPAGGVSVSTLAGVNHISPTMAWDGIGGDLYVFWDERNSSQSQWGIWGQKFDGSGNKMWTDNGRMFLPTDTLYKWAIRALPLTGGAMVFWIDEPGGYNNDRIRGFRCDPDGLMAWPGDIVEVSSYLSGKSRLPVDQIAGGAPILIWEDNRNGNTDIFAQSMNINGSLGCGCVFVEDPELPPAPLLLASFPNPFNPRTTIHFELPEAGQVELVIFDIRGRRVKELLSGQADDGIHEVIWGGSDDAGKPLASGVYLARLETTMGVTSHRLVLVR